MDTLPGNVACAHINVHFSIEAYRCCSVFFLFFFHVIVNVKHSTLLHKDHFLAFIKTFGHKIPFKTGNLLQVFSNVQYTSTMCSIHMTKQLKFVSNLFSG